MKTNTENKECFRSILLHFLYLLGPFVVNGLPSSLAHSPLRHSLVFPGIPLFTNVVLFPAPTVMSTVGFYHATKINHRQSFFSNFIRGYSLLWQALCLLIDTVAWNIFYFFLFTPRNWLRSSEGKKKNRKSHFSLKKKRELRLWRASHCHISLFWTVKLSPNEHQDDLFSHALQVSLCLRS